MVCCLVSFLSKIEMHTQKDEEREKKFIGTNETRNSILVSLFYYGNKNKTDKAHKTNNTINYSNSTSKAKILKPTAYNFVTKTIIPETKVCFPTPCLQGGHKWSKGQCHKTADVPVPRCINILTK